MLVLFALVAVVVIGYGPVTALSVGAALGSADRSGETGMPVLCSAAAGGRNPTVDEVRPPAALFGGLPDGISARIGLLGRPCLQRSTGALSRGCPPPIDDITGTQTAGRPADEQSTRQEPTVGPNPGSPAVWCPSLESVSARWAQRGERAPAEFVRVLLSIPYDTCVSEFHAPPPVLRVPPAAPGAPVLFEDAFGCLGEGGNARQGSVSCRTLASHSKT